MFILCNSFEVERDSERTDSLVIEDCGSYVSELTGYVVVCRQQNVNTLFQWAEKNMGAYRAMFEKQFSVSPMKAMSFVKVRNGIHSFTEDMLEDVSDVEEFKRVYCRHVGPATAFDSEQVAKPEPESVSQPESESVSESAVEPVSEPEPEPDSEPEPISEPELELGPAPEPKQKMPPRSAGMPVRRTSIDLSSLNLSARTEIPQPEPVTQDILHTTEIPVCQQHCIYNRDGSFKGFTEGQIVSMLRYLRRLDDRITLGSLDPDSILTDDDMEDAVKLVDDLSPGVLKSFIMYEVMNADTECGRIRITGLLDDLAAFLQSF